jgi:hypothetical protein
MVGIYFKTNHMPVRFLVYVGITAFTRLRVGDIARRKEGSGPFPDGSASTEKGS